MGVKGFKGFVGNEFKSVVGYFVEVMKLYFEIVEECDVMIVIENYGGNLIDSVDGMKWFVELCFFECLGIVFVFYYLL